MIQSISVINEYGDSLTIDMDRPQDSGFQILNIDGLTPVKASINSTPFSDMDGTMFNSAQMGERNIVLTLGFLENPDIETTRQLTYKYFPIKRPVLFFVETDNRSVCIQGYVESNTPVIFSAEQSSQISLVCTDPYFYSTVGDGTSVTVFSGVTPEFTFPFSAEIPRNNIISDAACTDVSKWSVWTGVGGVSTELTNGSSPFYGNTFLRETFTTVPSSGGGFTSGSTSNNPVVASTTYTVSAYIRPSVSLNVAAQVQWYNSGTPTSGGTGATTPCPANVWTRVSMTVTCPVGSNQAQWRWYIVGAGITAINQTLDINAAMCEVGTTLNPFYVGTYHSIEFGQFSVTNTMAVPYDGDGDVGVVFHLYVLYRGTASQNITIWNTQTLETMVINLARLNAPPFNTQVGLGDEIVVSTVKGNKFVKLIRNGVETNILSTWTKGNTWHRLHKGTNVFAYSYSNSGFISPQTTDGIQFTIENQTVYEGV